MRFVIFGAGAIGGVVGASLHQAEREVALIARGQHYQAIRTRGLTFERPGSSVTLEIPVASTPAELDWNGDEVVLLAVKSQDTAGALIDLRDAVQVTTPVVCVQNAVENERAALRLFPHVYGAVVMGAASRRSARAPAVSWLLVASRTTSSPCHSISPGERATGISSVTDAPGRSKVRPRVRIAS